MAKVVVIGVPGLTWNDVKASPELTALVNQSHVGSITVKTAGPHTCPIDGWLTISAGTRAWGSVADQPCGDLPAVTDGKVAGWQTYVDRQAEHHTGAPIGRLGQTGYPICGFGPGAAIALARTDGSVTNWQPEFDQAQVGEHRTAAMRSSTPARCRSEKDGPRPARRSRTWSRRPGRPAAGSCSSASARRLANAHQEPLVAMQLPPDNGPRWLTSDSTRRPGLIQLTDVTATILQRTDAAEVDPAGAAKAGPLDGNEIHFTGDRAHRCGRGDREPAGHQPAVRAATADAGRGLDDDPGRGAARARLVLDHAQPAVPSYVRVHAADAGRVLHRGLPVHGDRVVALAGARFLLVLRGPRDQRGRWRPWLRSS